MRSSTLHRCLALPLALGLASLVTAQSGPPVPGKASPNGSDVFLLDPKLPEGLKQDVREVILEDMLHSLGQSFPEGLKVFSSPLSGTLILKGDEDFRERAKVMAEDLRNRTLQHLATIEDEVLGRSSSRNFFGKSLDLSLEIVLATREASSGSALDPELARSLEAKLGFRGFQSVGKALVQAIVGTESKIQTLVPYGAGRSLRVSFALEGTVRQEELMIKSHFEVVQLGGAKGEVPIQTELSTTYRPRIGKPTLIGANPLSGDSSLLFVVRHSGEAIDLLQAHSSSR